mgnify:CR=1 FL=1
MKLFLELEKSRTEEEERKGVPQQFIRIEINSETEAIEKAKTLLPLIPGAKAYLHICRHDETPPRSCERKELSV